MKDIISGSTYTRRGNWRGDIENEKEKVRRKGGLYTAHACIAHAPWPLPSIFFFRRGPIDGEWWWGAPFPIRTLRARARVLTCPFQHPSLSSRVWPGDESPHGSVKRGHAFLPSLVVPGFLRFFCAVIFDVRAAPRDSCTRAWRHGPVPRYYPGLRMWFIMLRDSGSYYSVKNNRDNTEADSSVSSHCFFVFWRDVTRIKNSKFVLMM